MAFKQHLSGLHFILTALPLLIYPGIFVANLMSLAGHITGEEPLLLMMMSQSFLWLSLLYPVAYLICLIGFFRSKTASKKSWFVKAAYYYLLACLLLLLMWFITG